MFHEVFYVIEVLMGVMESSVMGVISLGFVWALKVAEKVQIECEFLCRDIILVLSPLLLYFLVEGVFVAPAAYPLGQWPEVIDPAF
jgi:hypothetical protein